MMDDQASRYGWQRQTYAQRVQLQQARLDDAASQIIAVCRTFPDIHAVYAFGSYARQELGPDSDLDLLVVRDTDRPPSERETDIRLALKAVRVGFDFLIVQPHEFEHVLPKNPFGKAILQEARLLVDYDRSVNI